jgi:hypothetical protein
MGVGEFDDKGIPETIEGYQRLNAIIAATDKNLTEILSARRGKPSRSDPQGKPQNYCLCTCMIPNKMP